MWNQRIWGIYWISKIPILFKMPVLKRLIVKAKAVTIYSKCFTLPRAANTQNMVKFNLF